MSHFGKRTEWSLIYFFIYAYLNISAQSQILVIIRIECLKHFIVNLENLLHVVKKYLVLENCWMLSECVRLILGNKPEGNFSTPQNTSDRALFSINNTWHLQTRLTLFMIKVAKSQKVFSILSVNQYTGSSCLMRISLLRISFLRFFKKIHKFALCEFMPYALGYFISLVQFFGQKSH